MFVFGKVLYQLISATLLKMTSITPSWIGQGICLYFKRSYLPNNLITAVCVSVKFFCSTEGKKCAKYFPLGLALKASMGMNHTTGIRISLYEM